MAIIDVVKFNGLTSRDWLIYKHYAEDLSTATQLIVCEGQIAVFIKGGKICDTFNPGTYTLTTNNIPILSSFINLPFGGKTPFTAEIYYINTVLKMDLNWGTSDPIQLIDPKYQIRLRIRAFGQVGLKISDCSMFVSQLIGSMNPSEIINYTKVLDFYKGILVSKVKSKIAGIIIDNGISALEISARLDDISTQLFDNLNPDFAKYGMNLVNFYVKSINFPEDDFEHINKILEDKAAFEIMGDSRYAAKRSFDVYEGAANNQNGVAGAFAAGGIGIGAGMAIGNSIQHNQDVISTPSKNDVLCPKCNTANPSSSKFCASCGSLLTPPQPQMIKCPGCGVDVNATAKFCNECGFNLQIKKCECGNELAPGTKFCNQCGKKVGD